MYAWTTYNTFLQVCTVIKHGVCCLFWFVCYLRGFVFLSEMKVNIPDIYKENSRAHICGRVKREARQSREKLTCNAVLINTFKIPFFSNQNPRLSTTDLLCLTFFGAWLFLKLIPESCPQLSLSFHWREWEFSICYNVAFNHGLTTLSSLHFSARL